MSKNLDSITACSSLMDSLNGVENPSSEVQKLIVKLTKSMDAMNETYDELPGSQTNSVCAGLQM
jgi:hypothetical protein